MLLTAKQIIFFESQRPDRLSRSVSQPVRRELLNHVDDRTSRGKLTFEVIKSENDWEKFNGR